MGKQGFIKKHWEKLIPLIILIIGAYFVTSGGLVNFSQVEGVFTWVFIILLTDFILRMIKS